ncbi:hypothetical protein K431DRAFT_289410 [Polychaeton citri CBS 116435]|uniref:Uncharacterized protein n=1 Tax=Polychaeton citri CBS 116435 TaxID=1314669 RepID=A0A9P4PYM9_9PEZI|nr:hypothetical protein K431DRAFT_289410 [Polychaeton citri CBS 116435]
MFSRQFISRALRATAASTSTAASAASSRTLRTVTRPSVQPLHLTSRSASHVSPNIVRWVSSKSLADEKIEEITDLYATAQDEFEIAMEETEKMTVYAEEDRKAAREELEKVKEVYDGVVGGEDRQLAEEVQKRIGQRIRELEMGVVRMEEMALEQD